MSESKVDHVSFLIKKAMEAESSGNRNEAGKIYKAAYSEVMEIASHSNGKLKEKRLSQAANLKKIYDSIGGEAVEEERISQGKKILETATQANNAFSYDF